jgi:hypothetical protein
MIPTTAPVAAPAGRRLALAATTAALLSGAACAAIALLATALGVPSIPQLTPPAVALFGMLGAIAGTVGWQVIRRRAARPGRVLRVLVPSVLLVSFVPDVVLGVALAASTGVAPVLALASMHLAAALIVVVIAAWLLPVREVAPAVI